MNTNEVKTDDNHDEQVDDWGSEFRCGDKMMLGSVVKMTKTEWWKRRLWHQQSRYMGKKKVPV